MAVKSSSGYRLPPPCNGLNVNFCKNPKCANFGVPEIPHRKNRKKGTLALPGFYNVDGSGNKNKLGADPRLKCGICGDKQPLRNNASIIEDIERISAYLKPDLEPSCPNSSCPMHGVPLSKGSTDYSAFGVTAAGTPRWRCNICKKTFTVGGKSTRKHKITHKNRDVFMLLMNKMSVNRIAEVTGLDYKSIYGKIDFIHRQCMLLAQNREKLLLEGFPLPKMYLAVDRQTHLVNWNSRKDRRNIRFNAIGTADLATGYVFGMHVNFDSSMTQTELDNLAQQAGDYVTPEPYRKYARFWLKPDYEDAIAKSWTKIQGKVNNAMAIARGGDPLTSKILGEYAAAKIRDDIEGSEVMTPEVMLPINGVLVREQYAIQSHFMLMAKLLANAPKVRYYLDQDSGFRAAFMAAFHDRVKAHTADAWYVRVLKGLSIDDKDKAIAESRRKFKRAQAVNIGLTDYEVKLFMVKGEMKLAVTHGYPDDQWVTHPLPNKSEPGKQVCWLTNPGDWSEDHAARLYLKASLHPIDRFFMLVRRRLSFAERAYASASQTGKKWYGYSAYRPDNLVKLLEIFRVFYNYCLVGDDNQTPAMRLGLARGPVAPEDVLYFEPQLSARKPRVKRQPVTKLKPKPVPTRKASVEDWLNQSNPSDWSF